MIKFRAWDMPFGKYGAMQEMVYSRVSHILALAEMEPEKYIPEQFTGLKDENGKEIYEGDVVQPVISYTKRNIGKPFEVKKGNYVYGKWIAKDVSSKGFGVDGYYFSNEMRLIGNVHENPELLEADK
ncbi:Phage protein [Lactiplantibacillus plantarum]|uniref:YopX family protein n=1 Tax=Lactiplantibacillus plantarum TaxID=1590 RepID=UPI0007C2037D|nr:YopX family protein [Lactiplantibacillus plantarum]KZU10457.1 Phage protein [Lactiplantibacillus plantarum]